MKGSEFVNGLLVLFIIFLLVQCVSKYNAKVVEGICNIPDLTESPIDLRIRTGDSSYGYNYYDGYYPGTGYISSDGPFAIQCRLDDEDGEAVWGEPPSEYSSIQCNDEDELVTLWNDNKMTPFIFQPCMGTCNINTGDLSNIVQNVSDIKSVKQAVGTTRTIEVTQEMLESASSGQPFEYTEDWHTFNINIPSDVVSGELILGESIEVQLQREYEIDSDTGQVYIPGEGTYDYTETEFEYNFICQNGDVASIQQGEANIFYCDGDRALIGIYNDSSNPEAINYYYTNGEPVDDSIDLEGATIISCGESGGSTSDQDDGTPVSEEPQPTNQDPLFGDPRPPTYQLSGPDVPGFGPDSVGCFYDTNGRNYCVLPRPEVLNCSNSRLYVDSCSGLAYNQSTGAMANDVTVNDYVDSIRSAGESGVTIGESNVGNPKDILFYLDSNDCRIEFSDYDVLNEQDTSAMGFDAGCYEAGGR